MNIIGDLINNIDDLNAIYVKPSVETHVHANENSADTRLFVWNFAPEDVKKFVSIFEHYNLRLDNDTSRRILNEELRKKCNSMLAAKCIPIECMLYASKVINARLDDGIAHILAERIVEVYGAKGDDTAEVLKHICNCWTWTPQLNAAIIAIGLIGERDELIDNIKRFAEDSELKLNVFKAFMHSKTDANLKRSMDIVIDLKSNDDIDTAIADLFVKEFSGFAVAGFDSLKKYLQSSHEVSKLGNSTLNKISRNVGFSVKENSFDDLASRSRYEEPAYHEFLEMCRQKNDDDAAFRCRFSRKEIIDDFLAPLIRSTSAVKSAKDNALISIAQLCGYKNNKMLPFAKKIIKEYGNNPANRAVCIVSGMAIGDQEAIERFTEILALDPEQKLHELYYWLRNASIAKKDSIVSSISRAICERFIDVFGTGYLAEMENFASNLQVFKSRTLGALISDQCLKELDKVLLNYARDGAFLPENAAIALINTGVDYSKRDFGSVLFQIYERTGSERVKDHARKMLLQMDTLDPKVKSGIR